MRDVARVKSKLELKLDSSQVFFLFAGLAAYSALIFVLGIVVGRSRHPETSTLPAPTLAVAASPTPVKGVEERLAAAQPSATEEPELPLGDVMSHLENATPAGAVPSPTKKAEPTRTAKAVASATATPAAASSQVAAAATPTPEKTAAPSSAGGFTLQVVAYNDRKQADAEVARLVAKGYEAYSVESAIPGKGTVHRVRIGHYPTRVAAESAAAKFAESGTKPLVVAD